MSQDTTQKLSFQQWKEVPKKEQFPWTLKPVYKSPAVPMTKETIYHNSFYPPGKYVDDLPCGECYCETIGECFDAEGNPPMKAHEYTICPARCDPNQNENPT